MSGAEDAVDLCFLAGGTLAEGREVFRSVTGEHISLYVLNCHRRLLIRRVERMEMMVLFLDKFAERKGLFTHEEVAHRGEEAEREILRRVAKKNPRSGATRRYREYCADDNEIERILFAGPERLEAGHGAAFIILLPESHYWAQPPQLVLIFAVST